MNEILKLLEEDGRYTAEQIGAMTGRAAADVQADIEALENDNVILGYTTLIDWDKTEENEVSALIEVKIIPQNGEGFDRIAERIYQYDEVESVYLMSGSFDLAVFITGESLREIAEFVSARLSPIEGVTATSTHFILKKYKEKHRVFNEMPRQEETVLFV